MKLSIYSLKKILYQGDARLLNCKTAEGEITVLDGHEPLIGVLKKGAIRIVDEKQKERFFPAESGFLEVKRGGEVKCLVD